MSVALGWSGRDTSASGMARPPGGDGVGMLFSFTLGQVPARCRDVQLGPIGGHGGIQLREPKISPFPTLLKS